MLSQGRPSPPEWSFSQKRNALSGFLRSTLLLSEAPSIRRQLQDCEHHNPKWRNTAAAAQPAWAASLGRLELVQCTALESGARVFLQHCSRIPLAEHSYLIYSLYSDTNFTLTTHLVYTYQKVQVLVIPHSYSTNDQPLDAQHIATIVDW